MVFIWLICLPHLFSCIHFIIYEQFILWDCWVELHFDSLLIYFSVDRQWGSSIWGYYKLWQLIVLINLTGFENHLGDPVPGVSLMIFSELSNWKWVVPPHKIITGKEKTRQTFLSLFPDWLSYEKTSIVVALGHASHYIFPAMMNCTFKPRAKINSFFFMLLLVMSY